MTQLLKFYPCVEQLNDSNLISRTVVGQGVQRAVEAAAVVRAVAEDGGVVLVEMTGGQVAAVAASVARLRMKPLLLSLLTRLALL